MKKKAVIVPDTLTLFTKDNLSLVYIARSYGLTEIAD